MRRLSAKEDRLLSRREKLFKAKDKADADLNDTGTVEKSKRDRLLADYGEDEADQIASLRCLVDKRRADAWRSDFEWRWRGLPRRPLVGLGSGCVRSVFPDEDGYGSWGRCVRLYEDREDPR